MTDTQRVQIESLDQALEIIFDWQIQAMEHIIDRIRADEQIMFEEMAEDDSTFSRDATEEEIRGFKRGLMYAVEILKTLPIEATEVPETVH